MLSTCLYWTRALYCHRTGAVDTGEQISKGTDTGYCFAGSDGKENGETRGVNGRVPFRRI